MDNRNTNTGLVTAIIVIAVVIVIGLLGIMMMGFGFFGINMMGGTGMMGFGGYGYNPVAMILSLLFGLLIIAGIVLLIVWLTRTRGPASYVSTGGPSSNALTILQERYARGEITKEQYDQMKRDLLEK